MYRHLILAFALALLASGAACSSDSDGDGGDGGDGDGGGAGGGGEAGSGAGDCASCDASNVGQVCPVEGDCLNAKVCQADPDTLEYAWRESFTHEDGDPCNVEGATCSETFVFDNCDFDVTTASCTAGLWDHEVQSFSCVGGQGGGGAGGDA